MSEFNKEDVLTMAKAILEEPLEYMNGDYTPYYFCKYCDAELHGFQYTADDFKHDLNCPVLIAQDILTGNTG